MDMTALLLSRIQFASTPRGTKAVPPGSGAVAKCLCVLTPGVLGPEYFEELAAEIATGKPNPAVMVGIMKRYGLIPATA